jgi:hypothetical protein
MSALPPKKFGTIVTFASCQQTTYPPVRSSLSARANERGHHLKGKRYLKVIADSYLVGICAMPPYSMHCSQRFRDRAITHPNEADARIIQVDGHPRCDRKNGSINGVKDRKSAAHATIAEPDHTKQPELLHNAQT